MPIRFRCAYCNQLLGIARRKSGTVVRCPTCAGQVIVPNADADDTEAGPEKAEQLVFERSDFEELLNPGTGSTTAPAEKRQMLLTSAEDPIALPSASNPPAGAWGTHAEPAYDVERIRPAPRAAAVAAPPAGIVLSPRKATGLLVAAIVALALAFGGGVLLGYFLHSSPG